MDVMTTIAALSKGLEVLKTLKDIDLQFDRATYKSGRTDVDTGRGQGLTFRHARRAS